MATVELTEDSFEAELSKDGIVLIDWWAPWCGPCRAFAPIYEQVSQRFGDITFAKIDTDAQPALASAFEMVGTIIRAIHSGSSRKSARAASSRTAGMYQVEW